MYCKFRNFSHKPKDKPCINSSKVYCKLVTTSSLVAELESINSSKVYCKSLWNLDILFEFLVLIVAKCIVNNSLDKREGSVIWGINSSKVYCKSIMIGSLGDVIFGINSSKVYCKSFFYFCKERIKFVLIVAKCIVNSQAISTFSLGIPY